MKCYRRECKLMGCYFELGLLADSENLGTAMLDTGIREIARIEQDLSEFIQTSFTNQINENAGVSPVTVSNEVYNLIKRANQIAKISEGYFDITTAPLKKLYRFQNDAFLFPEKQAIAKTLLKVGFKNIHLDEASKTVFLTQKGMAISFAAIGKGYAADSVKKIWQKQGINNGFINASGDLCAFGKNEDNEPWKVGIAHPANPKRTICFIPLFNSSISTSGNYEQFFIHKGRKYAHNLNPKNGLPLEGIKSVTVVSPSAELSDALATAVYSMGIDKGLNFANQLPHTHAIMINSSNQLFFSQNLHYESVD